MPEPAVSRADTTEGRTQPRDLAWFLARTPQPDGQAPPRTPGDWNRQSIAAFIARHSPEETPMPETAPRPDVPDELIDAVSNRLYSFTVTDPEDREHLAQVLAAAVPEVRERVAAEIEARVVEYCAEVKKLEQDGQRDAAVELALTAARVAEGIKIARGDS